MKEAFQYFRHFVVALAWATWFYIMLTITWYGNDISSFVFPVWTDVQFYVTSFITVGQISMLLAQYLENNLMIGDYANPKARQDIREALDSFVAFAVAMYFIQFLQLGMQILVGFMMTGSMATSSMTGTLMVCDLVLFGYHFIFFDEI